MQKELPEKSKRFPRLACLGLMEIEHDFINIRHYIEQWKLAATFGTELLKRMKKRVA